MTTTVLVALAALAGGALAGGNAPGGSGGYPPHTWSSWCPQPTPTYSTCGGYDKPPTFSQYTTFSYPQIPDPGTATSVTVGPTSTYGLAYTQVASLFSTVSSTTWPNWTPGGSIVTAPTDAPYGDEAYSALWNAIQPTNFTRGVYSTTASPTPIPTSELVKPPPLYFTPSSCYKFPKDFIFGTAGSAGQCEGATADDGKSPSFLDVVANILATFGQAASTSVTGKSTGPLVTNDVVAEHYYLYKQDIDRLAAAGIKHFYLTIAWTRILPFALPGTPVNEEGIQHYSDVIDYILSKGMIPAVAITHFDTPLQFYGGGGAAYLDNIALAVVTGTYGLGGVDFGYQNSTFEDAYVNYAQIVLSHYADRVPLWITFNEPQVGSVNAAAVTNVLRAHARTYHFYKDVLKGTGQMSIKMGITPAVPQDASDEADVAAAQYFTDLYTFPYLYPTILGEQLPQAFLETLPGAVALTTDDLALMKGTMDFVALDAYSAPIITNQAGQDLATCAADQSASREFPICVNATTLTTTGWSTGYSPAGSPTDYMEPFTLRTQLRQVWATFGKPIMVTEFGLSVPVPPGGRLQDDLYNVPQSHYILSYLDQMLAAIWEDGIDVMGAFVWNFLDDWEFGYEDHGYGLMYLDWETKERRYRRSIFDVTDFVESRRQTE